MSSANIAPDIANSEVDESYPKRNSQLSHSQSLPNTSIEGKSASLYSNCENQWRKVEESDDLSQVSENDGLEAFFQNEEGICYLITGGCGFLGRHLVEGLLWNRSNNPCHIKVLDKQPAFENEEVEFIFGDICNYELVSNACFGVDVVFHIASLTEAWGTWDSFYRVNVLGTENVIKACLDHGVEKLVYTSTGSVVIDGTDIKMGDESLEYPSKHLDIYSSTKAIAEKLVIQANGKLDKSGKHTLSTCSLRPHAMFGPRDKNFIAQLIYRAREGDITHMIGDGLNICDFTYVLNAVHAHILAAEKLSPKSPVAGECYFITNGEPRRFWDFIRTIISEAGCGGPTKIISFRVAYAFAYVMEILHWLFGFLFNFRPTITRHMVFTMCCHHWFTHHKASIDFGYKPIVSLADGIRETMAYFQQLIKSEEDFLI